MKIVAIVQARMASTRLPGKVMKLLGGRPIIEIILSRLAKSRFIDEIVVATTNNHSDDKLVTFLKAKGATFFRGDENDVLRRYVDAAEYVGADIVVRITGDCPVVDAVLVDSIIEKFLHDRVDYCSNVDPPTFPDGLDVEVFRAESILLASRHAKDANEREHVTPFLRKSNLFTRSNYALSDDLSSLRWTIDSPEDYLVMQDVFDAFKGDIFFSWERVLALKNFKPLIFAKNKHLTRNQGAVMGTGQKLWTRANQVIAGGNMLLSKNPEMFLPEKWPTYFSRSKGCNVWDLDGQPFIDMSIMGVGTNILGYAHSDVDAAVGDVVKKGNMTTLNCPEEVYLAEKLIELHPWFDMVRFARTGGEANAIAIRIARAASGRDGVAICGYHGWHDWYLAANLAENKNLDGHLLPGLSPMGVPKGLEGSVHPFTYNNFDELKALVERESIGVIKMEVMRNHGPENGFLSKVRDLASEKNIVLIFDECTSGFRESYGGLHINYGVKPDMAVFGKALGNGYAITAILGRREIMEVAQATFISSTFWTERIGPAAALKTLEVMKELNSWSLVTEIGKKIKSEWLALADDHQLRINLFGLDALAGFTFLSENHLAYKTYITQEMLSKGFLAGNMIYTCINHSDEILEQYLQNLRPIFRTIAECEDGKNISDLLHSPICRSGFKRLN